MKTPAILISILTLTLLSFSSAPIPKKEKSSPLILHQLIIDSVLFSEFTYTPQHKISEDKSKCQYIKYNYNDKDQVVSKTTYMDLSIASCNAKVIVDFKNRKELTNPGTSNPNFRESYEYDKEGKMIKMNTQGGVYWTVKYNSKNRIIAWYYFQDGIVKMQADYKYDRRGNLIKMTNYNIDQSGNPYPQTIHEYKYDDKVNPYHFFGLIFDPFGKYTNVNNVILEKYTLIMDKPGISVTKYEYEYNDRGYPVSVDKHTQFIYE